MRDPLDIARNAAEHAIAAGTREDAEHPAMEYHWLRRAEAFALIAVAESLREIIEWASIGDDESAAAAVLGASIAARTPLTVVDDGYYIPVPAEPLVMCGQPDGDSERCVLLPGHEGGHMAYFATGPSWRDEAEPLSEFLP